MRATKIKMKPGCGKSNNLVEIDAIYITGCTNEGFFSKATIHDYVKESPNSIQVNIYPYPDVVHAISSSGEKYIRSSSNQTIVDNLLNLPRE